MDPKLHIQVSIDYQAKNIFNCQVGYVMCESVDYVEWTRGWENRLSEAASIQWR